MSQHLEQEQPEMQQATEQTEENIPIRKAWPRRIRLGRTAAVFILPIVFCGGLSFFSQLGLSQYLGNFDQRFNTALTPLPKTVQDDFLAPVNAEVILPLKVGKYDLGMANSNERIINTTGELIARYWTGSEGSAQEVDIFVSRGNAFDYDGGTPERSCPSVFDMSGETRLRQGAKIPYYYKVNCNSFPGVAVLSGLFWKNGNLWIEV